MNIIEKIIKLKGISTSKDEAIKRLSLLKEILKQYEANGNISAENIDKIMHDFKEYAYIIINERNFKSNIDKEIKVIRELIKTLEDKYNEINNKNTLSNNFKIGDNFKVKSIIADAIFPLGSMDIVASMHENNLDGVIYGIDKDYIYIVCPNSTYKRYRIEKRRLG